MPPPVSACSRVRLLRRSILGLGRFFLCLLFRLFDLLDGVFHLSGFGDELKRLVRQLQPLVIPLRVHADHRKVVPHGGLSRLLDQTLSQILLGPCPLLEPVIVHSNAEVRVGIVRIVLENRLGKPLRHR